MLNKLSIVIPNYNYERFVASAIESALSVRWPQVEVIVVDDGSTDGSVEVMRRFGGKILIIEQENAGPRVACNTGFAASTGDWIMFLDSDDILHPDVAEALAGAVGTGTSKVQFQMQRIDAQGVHVGTPFPKFKKVPSPADIRTWMEKTASYPTPPGSGNAYARTFLEELFPLDDRCGDATDSSCLATAPFFGEVITVSAPLVEYRVHGRNRSYLLGDPTRFTAQIERAVQRHKLACEVRGLETTTGDWIEPIFRGRALLQLRVAHRRMLGRPSPIPGDGWTRLVLDTVRSPMQPGQEGILARCLIAAWVAAVLVTPTRFAQILVRRRYAQKNA